MATYIEDEETSKLIEAYAVAQGKTKTGALRDLLRRELDSLTRSKWSEEDRFQNLIAFVETSPTERSAILQADIDSLYEYLNVD